MLQRLAQNLLLPSSAVLTVCMMTHDQDWYSHCAPSVEQRQTAMSSSEVKQFGDLSSKLLANELAKQTKDDDEAWLTEKSNCSFCQHFLKSPCKEPFKAWSLCVDKAKDIGLDYVSACSDYTDALLNCTSKHSKYFEAEEKEEKGKEQ